MFGLTTGEKKTRRDQRIAPREVTPFLQASRSGRENYKPVVPDPVLPLPVVPDIPPVLLLLLVPAPAPGVVPSVLFPVPATLDSLTEGSVSVRPF